MKIGAKLKASLAIDNHGVLYSWGSASSGLLALKSDKNIQIPSIVPLNFENTSYKVQKLSVGHFHAAAIARRDEVTKLSGDINEAIAQKNKTYEVLFKGFIEWYEKIFITNLKINTKNFLRLILKLPYDIKIIEYKSLETNFLETFYSFMNIEKKDIFKMEKHFQKIIKSELEIPESKEDLEFNRFENILEGKNKQLNEIQIFINSCTSHFIQFPDDIPFFIRLVCQFKPFVGLSKIKKLFEYTLYNPDSFFNPKDFELFAKVCSFFNEIKISSKKLVEILLGKGVSQSGLDFNNEDYFVETNIVIDCIINRRTGLNVLFTWGFDTEGRLGFETKQQTTLNKEDSTNSNTNNNPNSKVNQTKNTSKSNNEDEQIDIFYYPRIVSFPSVHTKINEICCSYSHSLALSYSKHVFSWGSGKFGCLGQKNNASCPTPRLIEFDIDSNLFENIEAISCGMYFSMCLTAEGVVFTWGCGNNGRLGHGNENSVEGPKKLEYFIEREIKVMIVKCGDTHVAAISSAKELFTWGSGGNGMLGHGNFIDHCLPAQVDFFQNSKINSIFTGSASCIAVTSDNRVFSWGKNSNGMLGLSSEVNQNILIPSQVSFDCEEEIAVNEIAIGTIHTLFLMSNGTIYSCGNSLDGCLGVVGVCDKITKPTAVTCKEKFFVSEVIDIKENSIFRVFNSDGSLKDSSTLKGEYAVFCNASLMNSAIVTNKGNLFLIGEDSLISKDSKAKDKDKLSNPNQAQSGNQGFTTTKGKDITSTDVSATASSAEVSSTLKLKDEQTWSETIHKITCIELSEKVNTIALGKNHAICIARGKPYSWGFNSFGKLGLLNRSLNDYIGVPTWIEKLGMNAKMAAVSETHSMVLCVNGEIYAFGQNMYGKLGIGNFNKYFNPESLEKVSEPLEPEPQLVKNIIFADSIACSNSHSACIMKLDSNYENYYKVFTWGSGFSGKLGHSNFEDYYEPQPVDYTDIDDVFFIQVALGNEFTAALDINGNIWGWGRKKNLGFYGDNDVKNDFLIRPKLLNKELKFKQLTSNDQGIMALDLTGTLFAFGKFLVDGKIRFLKFDEALPLSLLLGEANDCPCFEFIAMGANHYVGVSDNKRFPYSWGSNLFFKCGQKFSVTDSNGITQETLYDELPRRIEYFFEILAIEGSEETGNKKALEGGGLSKFGKAKKNKIQQKLLDEKSDFKTVGLLKEDIRIIKLFYDSFSEFVTTMKEVEKAKEYAFLNIENKILSMINKTSCPKNSVFKSEIPKIISLNFQIYEAMITLLHIHPCYFCMVLRDLKNSKAFIPIVRNVFGKNFIALRNKRTLLMLLGLWNSVLEREKIKIKIENDKFDDLICFDLYLLVFQITLDNNSLILDIISEVIVLYINEICSNPNSGLIGLSEDSDILAVFRDLGDFKASITTKVCRLLNKRITSIFLGLSKSSLGAGSKGCFSFSVFWVFKQLSEIFFFDSVKGILKADTDQGEFDTPTKELNNNNNNTNSNSNTNHYNPSSTTKDTHTMSNNDMIHPFNKVFNFFLFSPFYEAMKSLKESKEEPNSPYSTMLNNMKDILERNSTQPGFSKLYNVYIADKVKCEANILKRVISPKSEIIMQIADIFSCLMNFELFRDSKTSGDLITMNSREAKREIAVLNSICQDVLCSYEYDFTLTALRENIKFNVENSNKPVVVSITIKDLIEVQSTFLDLINNHELSEDDPLRLVLYQISNFKLNELDSTSNIRNFVVNFYVKPNCFIYQGDSCKLFKCLKCKLPIPDVFFKHSDISRVLDGEDWKCSNIQCEAMNDKYEVRCTVCHAFKRSNFDDDITFFKKFLLPHDEEIIQTYESTLYGLPQLTSNDDIEKEVNSEIQRLNSIKDVSIQDKETLHILKKFINDYGNWVDSSEEKGSHIHEKRKIIAFWDEKLAENIEAREKHSSYLESLRDFITFLYQSADNAKLEITANRKSLASLLFNIKQGYSNNFLKDQAQITKFESGTHDNAALLKKFYVSDLIKDKVIDEILFNDAKQDKLENKTVLFFEKKNNGYNIRLVYKEINRKYILCGINKYEYLIESNFITNEAIYELRRAARTNSTINFGGIRFNTFYLIKLINSLENE